MCNRYSTHQGTRDERMTIVCPESTPFEVRVVGSYTHLYTYFPSPSFITISYLLLSSPVKTVAHRYFGMGPDSDNLR